MIVRKISILFLLGSLAVSITLGPRHSYRQAKTTLRADGGRPVPPVPPPPPTRTAAIAMPNQTAVVSST